MKNEDDKLHANYYELHVVVTGLDLNAWRSSTRLLSVLAVFKAWWSRISEDSSQEERPNDVIVTTRRKTLDEAMSEIGKLAAMLRMQGFEVTRSKVEAVVFDSIQAQVP